MKITPRTTLVIIAGIFLLPLVLAWLMYSGQIDFQPESTRNKGTLVTPAVPFDWGLASAGIEAGSTAETLAGHWVVLYPLQGECGAECLDWLASVRQVHLASGRNRNRIRLVVLLGDTALADIDRTIRSIYNEFILLEDRSGELQRVLESVSATVSSPGGTYLIDPLSHIMMVYPSTASPNDLKADLARLLKWSKLDEQ